MKNPFIIDTRAIDSSYIIDREFELSALTSNVVEGRSNALLVGDFGIGKTCLLKKLRASIFKTNQGVLLVEADMRCLDSEDSNDFLKEVILSILLATCKKITGKSTAELRQGHDPLAPLSSNAERLFAEWYRLISGGRQSRTFEESYEGGIKTPVAGTRAGKSVISMSDGDLTPSQFLAISGELITLLAQNGIDRIIVFGDEANHVSPTLELDALQRNLEIFGSQNMQFVLTSQPDTLERVHVLRKAFPEHLELQGFREEAAVRQLLEVYLLGHEGAMSYENFSDEVVTQLWVATRGNPGHIQRICRKMFEDSVASSQWTLNSLTLLGTMANIYDLAHRKRY